MAECTRRRKLGYHLGDQLSLRSRIQLSYHSADHAPYSKPEHRLRSHTWLNTPHLISFLLRYPKEFFVSSYAYFSSGGCHLFLVVVFARRWMGSISGVLSAANLFTLVVPIHVYLSSLFAELLARHFSLCVSLIIVVKRWWLWLHFCVMTIFSLFERLLFSVRYSYRGAVLCARFGE
jgi:hypothetical protein